MNQDTIDMVEKIMDTAAMGYGYLYPQDGGARKEYLIATTPENLANFIGSHCNDAEKVVVTDMSDRPILDACGGFLNSSSDTKLCREIIKHLAVIQMGEKEAGEILAVDRTQADEYWAMEDAAVTMAEYHMEL